MSVKHALAMAKNRAFADHIAQQLAERGWSLKRLATEAGATYTTARWGTGAPSPKVTAKNGQVTFPKFALTLADDGTVRVTLDLVNLSIEQASQLLAWLHENGLLSKERA
jgi:hypothetical protein